MNLRILKEGAMQLLVKRAFGPFRKCSNWLNKTQWYSGPELKQLQLSLLKQVVRHCYETVPFYRDRMRRQGFDPEHIQTLDDLTLLPILTKQEVFEAGTQIVSQRYNKWMLRHAYTGGTTGTALRLYRSRQSLGYEHAFVRRQWSWAGMGLKDRTAYLSGRLITDTNRKNGKLYGYDPFMHELIFSTYHLSPERARQFARVIKDYKVKAVAGYASAIHILAQTCLDCGIELPLQAALTSSETLSQSMRETITKAFGCPVYDFYGSAERVCYIFTCEKNNYHLIPEYGITELIPIDESQPDRCKVISTGFWNMAMPFLRYDLGDIVIKSQRQCPCGRQFEVIESIEGRGVDSIVSPSGRQFSSVILTHMLYGTQNILESQIIQDTPEKIRIEYVPGQRFTNENLNQFQRLIHMHLPDEFNIKLSQVQSIKRTNNGKLRPVVSNLRPEATSSS